MVQQAVTNRFLATGIPGEFSRSENQRSRGAIINSASEANNVPGRVVLSQPGNQEEVVVGATGNFSGILACPKTAIRPTLEAQSYITNETQIEVAESGNLFVSLPSAADIGDFVYYSTAAGVDIGSLVTAAAGATAPADSARVPGGIVTGYNVDGAGVTEISFDINGSTETPS